MISYENGVLSIVEAADKVRITYGNRSYNASMSGAIALPCSYGDGTYTIEVFTRIEGNRYRRLKLRRVVAHDTAGYMLQPNQYVPLTAAWSFARRFCDSDDLMTRYKAIKGWIKSNIIYDYITANTGKVKAGQMPDPARCYERRMGICQDIASLACGMFRAADIPSRMCFGWANKRYHAWVECRIGDKLYRFDHPTRSNTYVRERWF